MAKLTTQKAVHRVLNNEDYLLIWLEAGFSKEYRRKCRHRLRKQELSVNIQEKILTRCGFTSQVVEKKWDIPLWV